MEREIKAYLAGPEVFFENSQQVFEESLKLCEKYNITPLSPIDSGLKTPPEGLSQSELAKWIFQKNCDLIEEADIIIANLNPFRGFEPDSGTVWECGYAFGLNKPGFCFLENTDSMLSRLETTERDGDIYCQYGYRVENFSSPLNLMLSGWMTICKGGLEDALKVVSKEFKTL